MGPFCPLRATKMKLKILSPSKWTWKQQHNSPETQSDREARENDDEWYLIYCDQAPGVVRWLMALWPFSWRQQSHRHLIRSLWKCQHFEEKKTCLFDIFHIMLRGMLHVCMDIEICCSERGWKTKVKFRYHHHSFESIIFTQHAAFTMPLMTIKMMCPNGISSSLFI